MAWYETPGSTPRRYRSATAMWADPQLATLAPLRAPAVLAAARLASPGSPVGVSGNAPFVAERFAWSLNGVVDGWHDGVGDELRNLVSARRATGIDGVTDGETLFALALDALDRGAGLDEALAGVVATVESRTTGRLNLLLTDGETVAGSARGNSLFALTRDGSHLLASEPLDDDERWTRLDDGTVMTADADRGRRVRPTVRE